MTYDVSPEDGEKLLDLLRACAHAPPATEGLQIVHHYKSAEALLKDILRIILKSNSGLATDGYSTGIFY